MTNRFQELYDMLTDIEQTVDKMQEATRLTQILQESYFPDYRQQQENKKAIVETLVELQAKEKKLRAQVVMLMGLTHHTPEVHDPTECPSFIPPEYKQEYIHWLANNPEPYAQYA